MIVQLTYSEEQFSVDLAKPIDISIPVGQVKCFYAPDAKAEPFEAEDFVGSVSAGSPVNFYNLFLNPHGNGTHTEGLGHITLAHESVNAQLKSFHFIALLVSVPIYKHKIDSIVNLENFKKNCPCEIPKALLIRTLPNDQSKLSKDYSGTNPPYLEQALIKYLVNEGVEHLIVDLPSVDREQDEGKLVGHKTFWKISDVEDTHSNERNHCTITELVYLPDEIKDGLYLLNLQIPSIHLDAVPSKPVLYKLLHK